MRAMYPARLIVPLLCALSLLFAQQAGAAHTLSHELGQQSQQHKHSSDSPACEKCAAYAQLGNALNAAAIAFVPPQLSGAAQWHHNSAFQTRALFAAVARGPPASLQTHA